MNAANIAANRQPRTATNTAIHPTATIGGGSVVWSFATILADVVIGEDCSVGTCAEIGRASRIGRDTRIGHGVFLPPGALIGNGVFIGPNATFTDDKWPRSGNVGYTAQPPIVEDGASIGAGAVVLPGVRIGAGATVGAGAIVAKDVAPGAVVRCEPARERPAP